MQASYQGQIKTTNLIADDNKSHYWLITVPIGHGKNNQKSINVEFLFDSGVGGSLFISDALFDKLSADCKVVGGQKVVSIFGVDVPFYKPKNAKYDKVNILGLNTLQLTKSAIVKDHGEKLKFTWTANNNVAILPKVLYKQTFHPLAEGQTKFNKVQVMVNQQEITRTIIFDTGFGWDYGEDASVYFTNDEKLTNSAQTARILFKKDDKKYQPLFKLSHTKQFLVDIVGPKKFIDFQIVFIGKGDKLEWAIADK